MKAGTWAVLSGLGRLAFVTYETNNSQKFLKLSIFKPTNTLSMPWWSMNEVAVKAQWSVLTSLGVHYYFILISLIRKSYLTTTSLSSQNYFILISPLLLLFDNAISKPLWSKVRNEVVVKYEWVPNGVWVKSQWSVLTSSDLHYYLILISLLFYSHLTAALSASYYHFIRWLAPCLSLYDVRTK